MSFKNAVLATPVAARTTNGMKALRDTMNEGVTLFYQIGASRGKNITAQFERAYQEDRDVALRIAQWLRDVRGGAGERELFRQILKYLEKSHKEDLLETNILKNVSEIGRWDDLLIFTDNEVKEVAYGLIRDALESGNGLAAKWCPRKGNVAVELRNFLGYSPKFYRKRLVELTKVVETQMCAKEFDKINFSHVPSLAMSRYSKAFGKNAPAEFTSFKESLKKGDPSVKVNAGAVYPYDITKNATYGDNALADEQWKALPNFMGDSMVLPLVDVSGSMSCPIGGVYKKGVNTTCMDVALSLGLYCADKNTGPFKDLFLTFSAKPTFQHLKGSLSQKLTQMRRSQWDMSTNLHGAFDEILKVAVNNKVDASDMPKILLILSDMQFNRCTVYDNSAVEMIRSKYNNAGYEVPAIVFWNLNANDNVPVKFNEKGVALVSGFSPAIMKAVLGADLEGLTPEAVMYKAIMSDRYAY